jgi:excisionase family DNA binding protein
LAVALNPRGRTLPELRPPKHRKSVIGVKDAIIGGIAMASITRVAENEVARLNVVLEETDPMQVLSLGQAAKLLGCQPAKLYVMLERGDFASYKDGRHRRIFKVSLIRHQIRALERSNIVKGKAGKPPVEGFCG